MKYLILISLSLGIVGCDGYETNYQASIDKQGMNEEVCNLRDWAIECERDAYSIDDINACGEVFGKRHHDIGIRYNVPMIHPRVTPQHASNQHLLIVAKNEKCLENSQSFYDDKRCMIRLHEDMKKKWDC